MLFYFFFFFFFFLEVILSILVPLFTLFKLFIMDYTNTDKCSCGHAGTVDNVDEKLEFSKETWDL